MPMLSCQYKSLVIATKTQKSHSKLLLFSRKCCLPLLMSSSWGSGEGLSFKGEVLGPTGGFVGALNGIGGGGGGGCGGCGGRVGCCSMRAWILLLPSALKWDIHEIASVKLEGQKQYSNLFRGPSTHRSLHIPVLFKDYFKTLMFVMFSHELPIQQRLLIPVLHSAPDIQRWTKQTCNPHGAHV